MPVKAASDYQRLLSTNWDAPGATRAELVVIPDYDVRLLHVEWPDAGVVGPVTLTYRVATCDRRVSLTAPSASRSGAADSASTLEEYLRPTRLLPTDGIVRGTAQRICEGHQGDD